MSRISVILLNILILCCSYTYADGARVDTSFYSQSLQMNRMVDVYLPEGYDPAEDISYPTIYFLHGAGGTQDSYPEIISILDTLIAGGYMQPTIVVKPSGFAAPYAGSMWTNSELYGDFEDFVVYDLIEFIEESYNVYTDMNYRCITGHSMGGIGSMKIALAHSDKYRAVAALSGALDLNVGIDLWIPHILAESGGSPPYSYSPFGGTFSLLTFMAAGAFSPNLESFPYLIDFPLDDQGQIIESVYVRWLPHNPANMIDTLPPDHNLAIYFDCGTYDHLEFYPMAVSFAESLDNYAYTYQFQSFSGDHYSETRPPIAFVFLDSVMNTSTGIDDMANLLPRNHNLMQNYPNPFNGSTMIEFDMANSGKARLDVYNMLGQHVTTLLDRNIDAGTNKVYWDASMHPSGIYFYRLNIDDSVISNKMTLLK